jgi:UDP-glucose 4-epimerase
MRVLVTGGAGYIGSITVAQLIADGAAVMVLDNLSQGHLAAVHPQACFVHGDLANKAIIDAAMENFLPDAVMHFAAHTLVGESVSHPFIYLGTNVANGLNLLESAVEHGVGRFILSSTANLFDAPKRMPITEEECIAPGSPYGESKYMLERALYWLERTKGMRYACLRYFNAAGALPGIGEDHAPETHLIPLVLEVALGKRDKICVFGNDYPTPDGTCVRDYVHVADLAQAHILALKALDGGSRTYNLGNGRGYSILEVIAAAEEVTGRKIKVEFGPRRSGDPATLIAGSDKIRRELGWQPRCPELKDIIRSAWDWHESHPHGYGD